MMNFKTHKTALVRGRELKAHREALGIYAKDVGKHFSKSTRTIYRWEDGFGLTPYFADEYEKFLHSKDPECHT